MSQSASFTRISKTTERLTKMKKNVVTFFLYKVIPILLSTSSSNLALWQFRFPGKLLNEMRDEKKDDSSDLSTTGECIRIAWSRVYIYSPIHRRTAERSTVALLGPRWVRSIGGTFLTDTLHRSTYREMNFAGWIDARHLHRPAWLCYYRLS